jgi:lipoprotein
MKKILLSVAVMVSMMFTACNSKSGDVEKLRQENDSLVQLNAQTKADFDEMLQLMNDVEDGFKQIKEAENYLVVQSSATGEVDMTTRERLKSDMQLVAQTLKDNKEKLAKLQSQLKNSKYQSSQFQKTVERLNAEIESKTAMIVSLQEELAKRDVRIQELDNAVSELADQVNTLSEETEKQKSTISSQEKEINTVYYVFGTTKELKEQKIISGGGLFKASEVMKGDFNKNYFTKEDLRTFKQVSLESKKAKLLTAHPEGSYTFEKNDKDLLTLVITNPTEFWSLSKYLVIKVD